MGEPNQKHADFLRLGTKRVDTTTDALRIISNLCGPNYSWTPSEVVETLYEPVLTAIIEGLARFRETKSWRDQGGDDVLSRHPLLGPASGLVALDRAEEPITRPVAVAEDPEPRPIPVEELTPSPAPDQPKAKPVGIFSPLSDQVATAVRDDTLPIGEGERAVVVRRGMEVRVIEAQQDQIAELRDRIAELEGRKPKPARLPVTQTVDLEEVVDG